MPVSGESVDHPQPDPDDHSGPPDADPASTGSDSPTARVNLTKPSAAGQPSAYAVTQTAPTPPLPGGSVPFSVPFSKPGSGPQYAVTGVAPTGPPSYPIPSNQFPTNQFPTNQFPTAPIGYGPPPGYPPVRRRRRGVGVALVGVALVCVAALVVGGVVWWQKSKASNPGAPLAGQLTKQFPTAPSASWSLTSSTVGTSRFTTSDPAATRYLAPGAIADDHTLLTFASTDQSDDQRLIGIDTSSGKYWTLPEEWVSGCAQAIIGHRTACYRDSAVMFVDTTTGTVTRRDPVTGISPYEIAFDGANAYLRQFPNGRMQVTKYTPNGIAWSRTYPQSANALPSGDSSKVLTTGSLYASAGGGIVTVISTADGREIVNRPGRVALSALPDGSIVFSAGRMTDGSAISGPVTVVRPDGSATELGGESAVTATVADSGYDTTVFVDGKPTSLATRSSSWPGTSMAAPAAVPLAAGNRTVFYDGTHLTAVDSASGTQTWSVPTYRAPDDAAAVTDGDRMIYTDESKGLTALDLSSGAPSWSIPAAVLGTAGSDATAPAVYAVGDMLVAVTGAQITGFAPTGGAASAPGAADDNSGDTYVTRCGSPPKFTPEQFTTSTGGLAIRMKVTATCPDGDVLAGAQTRVTIRDGNSIVASGYFDFSKSPLTLPGPGDSSAGRTLELTFPSGTFYRLPDTLSSSGGSTYLVECDRGSQSNDRARLSDAVAGGTASGPAAAPGVDTAASVDDALRRQANSDRAFILANLNNRWVAQLSSKRPGLVADGKTWSNQDILDEFLALRLRFNDVRLLWSDEWPVFNYRGWWVTVAAATFAGPEAATAWCPQQGFDPDHCFGKFISTTAGPENSTRYWH